MNINYPKDIPQIHDQRILFRSKVDSSTEEIIPSGCFHPENWDEMVLAYSKRRFKK